MHGIGAESMNKFDAIIWDWNGTLLDDVNICIESMNHLLAERGRSLLSRLSYREIFTFPVRNYYELAGFDFQYESFDDVAIEFIDLYRERIRHCSMFPDAQPVLQWFSRRNFSQYLISAMEHQFLMESLLNFGIKKYFKAFTGIHDHYANGKLAMAENFISENGINPARTLLIGDTLHDFEVAEKLGLQCLLVAGGHQSETRLQHSGCEVFKSLSQVIDKFNQ
jgi:phosphoglycolate phosphatase